MTRCPAHGNRIQLTPSRAVNLFGATPQPDCRRTGFTESFNGRFQDEFLNTELCATVAEAQGLANCWRWEYNTLRAHSALQARTPLEAAQAAAA
jgi:transposase InsO family protein